MPQEADFPGLDVQKCYEILETLGDKSKNLSLDEINQLKEQFWHILENEITKINHGYTEREELCCKRFQMFDFRTFIISQRNNMSVCRLFQEALREVYNHFETAQMSTVLNNMPKTEKNNENLFYYAQYHSFCELLRDVHLLRDFTIQTFQILTVMISNLKKHIETYGNIYGNISEEISIINRRFKQICSLPLYTSPILAKLATRTEVIATSLLCAQNACAPQQTAFVCFNCHTLSKDMFVLRCFHRFCGGCANYLKSSQQMDCPTCGRHDALLNLEKDEPLRSFISTHFGANLLTNSTGNTYNAMQPPSLHHNNNKIKSEPNDNVLIPSNGVPYYDQSLPAYLIPGQQLKTEDQTPMKRGRGRPRGRGRGRPRGTSNRSNGSDKLSRGRGRPRVTSANSLHAARSKIKNGGRAKTSCHQCKNNKDPSELLFCKNVKWGPGKKKGNMVLKHCRKKFCAQCMGKYETIERVDELFRLQEDGQLTEWQCPACADTCECAACWRKRHPNTAANIPKPQSQSSVTTPQQPQQQQQQQQNNIQTQGNINNNNNAINTPQTPQFNNTFNMSNMNNMNNMPPTI